MYKIIIASMALSSMVIMSCNDGSSDSGRKDGFGDQPKTKEDSLFHQIMEGHDVGMAKMGQIRKYEALAQQQLDSLAKLPAAQHNKAYQENLLAVQQELGAAGKNMDTWMEEFNPDSLKDDQAAHLKYYQAEVDRVAGVKKQILDGLQHADSLFKK